MLGNYEYSYLQSPEFLKSLKNKDKDVIKRAQEYIGADADGIWGKKSTAAYNDKMSEASLFYPQKTDIPRNRTNSLYDDVNNAEIYDFNQNDAVNELNNEIVAEERQNQIQQLTSKIAEIEQRLAENISKLNSMDVDNKLAGLEAGKIGFRFNRQMNNDPTSLFRWAKQNEDARNQFDQQMKMQREQAGLNAVRTSNEIDNNIAQINEIPLSNNADMLEQQINQMIRSKYELKTKGATPEQLNVIDNKINEAKLKLNGETPPDEPPNKQTSVNSVSSVAKGTNQDKAITNINTIIKKQNPSTKELIHARELFRNHVKDPSYNSLLTEIENKLENAQKQEQNRASNKAFEDWATEQGYTKAQIEQYKDVIMGLYKNKK